MASSGEFFKDLTDEAVTERAKELLGTDRMEALGAFNDESYLQRRYDAYRHNPNLIPCFNSPLGGGNALLAARRLQLEERLRDRDDPYAVPRASSLDSMFKIGFGLVSNTMTQSAVNQATPEQVSPDAYRRWLLEPRDVRLKSIQLFLESQKAPLLALNFLHPEHPGTISHFASMLTIVTPRVTGEDPFLQSANDDTEAQVELLEGSLAALYLVREHYVAQTIKDMAYPTEL